MRDEAAHKGDSSPRDLVGQVLPGEAATLRAAQEALDGHRTGLRALWPFLGPAFIASVAYLDPGNFATDVAGGAKYGYLLLWAVLAANLMAMVVQTLSAKLGIATGRNLRRGLPRRVPAPGLVRALAPGRGGGDGDRPRRGARAPRSGSPCSSGSRSAGAP